MPTTDTAGPEPARITVSRSGRYGLLRSLRILLDGSEVGSLGQDDIRSFAIAPGEHELALLMDWIRSDPVRFSCAAGERLDVHCVAPNLTFLDQLLRPFRPKASRFYTVQVRREDE